MTIGDESLSRQTRREFCAHGCQAAVLAACSGTLGSLLAACASSNPTAPSNVASLPVVTGSITNRTVSLTVDSSSPLAPVGGAALVQFVGGALLAVRTSDTAFTALSAMCTHQACTITGFSNQIFVCPCHGSQFDTSGRVVMGPALASLQQYPTQFANNVLTVSV
jgi:cytochrome b6-f complex iron-sulfur subunit